MYKLDKIIFKFIPVSKYFEHLIRTKHIYWCIMSFVNVLTSNDDIWHHSSLSVLVHVMVSCLTAPNHYLIQCWHIFNWTHRNFQWDCSQSDTFFVNKMHLKMWTEKCQPCFRLQYAFTKCKYHTGNATAPAVATIAKVTKIIKVTS